MGCLGVNFSIICKMYSLILRIGEETLTYYDDYDEIDQL